MFLNDIPTNDIAIRMEVEPTLLNQIVKKKLEKIKSFPYRNPEIPEIFKLRWLKPYVINIYYYKGF